MTLTRIGGQLFVTETLGLFEETAGTSLTKNLNGPLLAGVKRLPDVFHRRLIHVAEDDPAARAAEDVSIGVDVDPFGPEECGQAVHVYQCFDGPAGQQMRRVPRRPTGETKWILMVGQSVGAVTFRLREITNVRRLIEVFLPADLNAVGPEDLDRHRSQPIHGLAVNIFLVERIHADLEPLHTQRNQCRQAVGDNPGVSRPETVRLDLINGAEFLLTRFAEDFDKVVPVEKGFSSGEMDFGRTTGEGLERSPSRQSGLDGQEPPLLRRAMIVTKLAGSVALVRQHQSGGSPKLELGLLPRQAAIVDILRQRHHRHSVQDSGNSVQGMMRKSHPSFKGQKRKDS